MTAIPARSAPGGAHGVPHEGPPSREECLAAARRLGSPHTLLVGILDLVGARALALDTLLRLSAVEWSDEVTSACVECTDRPRLLLNPAFVERWCATRERLAMLLLHELAHVSMGHTRLFPRPTPAHNLACDAIINRELIETLIEIQVDLGGYTALLEQCYAPDASPWFLLRPPPGWPQAPDWDISGGCPERLREIHRRLYARGPALATWRQADSHKVHSRHTVLYAEIVEALHDPGSGVPVAGAAGARDGAVADFLARLLGSHGTTDRERAAMTGGRDAAAGSALAEALGPIAGRLAGAGGDPFVRQVGRAARRAALQRALAALIRRAFAYDSLRRGAPLITERPTRGVDPRQDRRAAARLALARALGAPRPVFFDGAAPVLRPAPRDALVYLDVSASMFDILPALHAALVPLRRQLRPRLHVFSTTVVPVRAAEFDRGRLPTRGGTSIAPVLEHLLDEADRSGNRTALVLTDGFFDAPPPRIVRAVQAAHLRVHLGIAGPGPMLEPAPWAASRTQLPPL